MSTPHPPPLGRDVCHFRFSVTTRKAYKREGVREGREIASSFRRLTRGCSVQVPTNPRSLPPCPGCRLPVQRRDQRAACVRARGEQFNCRGCASRPGRGGGRRGARGRSQTSGEGGLGPYKPCAKGRGGGSRGMCRSLQARFTTALATGCPPKRCRSISCLDSGYDLGRDDVDELSRE